MKKLNYLSVGLLGILIGLMVVLSLGSQVGGPVSSEATINYNSNVCVYKNGELIDCSHNLLTNAGKELIETILGDTGSGGPVQYIALCNSTAGCTAPDASDTTLDNEFTGCGLSRAQGTYGDLGTGNWSIWYTFTSTCDNVETNMTGLFNQDSGGTLFAENQFTGVTLQTNDQLTINWTIWVE